MTDRTIVSMMTYEKALAATLAAAGVGTPDTSEMSGRDRNVIAAFKGGSWGEYTPAVAALVSALIGVDITSTSNQRAFVLGTVIVVDNYLYFVRQIDSDGDARIFDSNLESTTHSGDSYISDIAQWRYATKEEIANFFGQDLAPIQEG